MIPEYDQSQSPNILDVTDLSVGPTSENTVDIIRDLNFSIKKGATFGIIGETGCGKTMTAKAIMNLLPLGIQKKTGEIFLDGIPIHTLPMKEMRNILGKKIAFIPQNSAGALNPLYKVGPQFEFVLKWRFGLQSSQVKRTAKEWFEKVKLENIERIYESYPCQLSGGQLQRITIALALSLEPTLLIADEPTTALDSITRKEILTLLTSLKKEYNLNLLLITHDVSVVQKICDRVAVMYAGEIVECGLTEDLLKNPKHPYLTGLLNALPSPNKKRLEHLTGSVPTLQLPLNGCTFFQRCKDKMDHCNTKPPPVYTTRNREIRCFLYENN
jgi:oligopeptide/dipeptide ABC transporter ATP-binding protein